MIRSTITIWLSSALLVGAGCGSNDNPNYSPSESKIDLVHINDKTQVDPPNEFGFSKISIRNGENYQEGVLDAQRQEVIVPSTKLLVHDITDSMALIGLENKFLFVPLEDGPYSYKELSEVDGFQYATPYRCGVAMVVLQDLWFYIKEDGTRVSEESFDWAEPFHLDRALVKNGERFQIIKPDGTVVKVLEYDQASVQSPWCWQVTSRVDGKWKSGFVDLDGNRITDLIFDNVGYYDPEVQRIRVYKDERFGFVDERANLVIPVHYEYANPFDRGTSRVTVEGRTFLIDPNGNVVPD
ncbi:hypothetical protein VN12_25155 [Pirellula sp. SH-Sr6A]|uniref:WG repeat-containing protein n=1 Tax=Pirellula sp. SH-Sr6A TaxID=1632865 RepID=UPI00078BE7E5|nr:WG repeat-containing protein [Pirellula sp. SH-Sr6A]AMV35403.1 hypothetical protein VN12_25155 [Pirellula sp. SH-Sr6A]